MDFANDPPKFAVDSYDTGVGISVLVVIVVVGVLESTRLLP